MNFFLIKAPRNNEYTYEKSQAVFAGLASKKTKTRLLPTYKTASAYYSFNIISVNQRIYFVVGALDKNVDHLKNQILGQFPKSDFIKLESLQSLGKIAYETLCIANLSLSGGNLAPLKTITEFQDVDPTVSILSAMSRSNDPKAVFWMQLIITPDNKLVKRANAKIAQLTANEITSLSNQNEIKEIEEKIKHTGFKVYARLAAKSTIDLQMFFNSFNVFSQPSGNRFLLKKPRFYQKTLVTPFVQHKPSGKHINLNALELSTLWHIPAGNINIPNISWGKRLQLDSPENLPVATENMTKKEKAEITFIGKTVYKNRDNTFGIKNSDRLRHVYLVGKTGTGKSWFIDNMAIEDIRKGNGVAVLDPHGDAIDNILDYIPKNRINDVCYFNPSDTEYTYPLNILELTNAHQRDIMVSGIIGIFYKLYAYSWGPRMEHILRNVLFTLTYAENATLPDILKILHNKKYRNKVLEKIDDPIIHQFWKNEYEAMSERFLNEAISPILNKVGQFVTSPNMRRILEQPRSKVKIEELMDNKKIFLADLSQGKIGEDNATLLGSMIITKIQIAAMNRAFQKEADRIPFYMYVDEFQNFATGSFTKILSEARKYKLGLTLANQYITQIDPDVMNAILGNVGTLMCFNVGAQDSDILYKEFGSKVEQEDLTSLDQYQMIGRVMIDKVTSPAFTFTALPLPKNKSGHRNKIIEQSRKRYGVKIR